MKKMKEAYELCIKKIDLHLKNLSTDLSSYPCQSVCGEYYKDGLISDFYDRYCWTTSLTTGLALLAYSSEKDNKYLIWANNYKKYYHDKVFNHSVDTMHDLGFLYMPYSVKMYKLTNDEGHKKDALKAADLLLDRFKISGGYIDAFNRIDDDTIEYGRPIIDCMMNISLLFWAWKETGYVIYRDAAKSHGLMMKKYLIRDDYSVCHSFDFDLDTGKPVREHNECGFSNGSYWARGTAWAIYGFSIMAYYLESEDLYSFAGKLIEKYIDTIGDNYVPVWDFRLPEDLPAKICNEKNENTTWDESQKENCIYNVDTSAAAIAASGMIEYLRHVKDEKIEKFVYNTLDVLSSDKYLVKDMNKSAMLSHVNGRMIHATYADYFYVEALQKYLYDIKPCWID